MNAPPTLSKPPSARNDNRLGEPVLLAVGLPRRLVGGDWPCRFSFEAGEQFDGLIVADAAAASDAARLLREKRAWLAPVVDLTGRNLGIGDFSAEAATHASLREGIEQALAILSTLHRLPASVLSADDSETLLLARVYSRKGRLEPIYDGATPQLLRYPLGSLEVSVEIAERLTEAGWLSRTFFDRLHFCPACQSSRLNAREECSACRSPDVREESIINHFRCAHQATERQFSQGDQLICPKCRRELRHFGVDYDRPGSATICGPCGQVDADAAIGFLCIDCGARHDAAVVPTRSWYAYALTTLGERRLLNGDLRMLRSSGVDEYTTFRALLDHWMHIRARYRRPVAMLSLAFTRAREVQNRQGARVLSVATKQAVEIVRGELRASDFMVETGNGLLIVMPETDAGRIDVPRRRILNRISSTLSTDLGIEIRTLNPADMLSGNDIPV